MTSSEDFESQADGKLLDSQRIPLAPETALDSLSFLQPSNGAPILDRVILVNGIMTNLQLHLEDMQALANTGAEVIGVHNATYGLARDVKQCVYDLMNKGKNPAVETIKHLIRESLQTGETLHLIGHSQGAIIISRALRNIVTELKQQAVSREQIVSQLSHIRVETYGGGAAHYTDGPQYVHVDNWLDPIPFNVGVGLASRIFNHSSNPGKGAVQYTFFKMNSPWKRAHDFSALDKEQQLARYIDYMIHGPQDIYFPQRKSFQEMREKNFSDSETGFTLRHK